MTYIAWFSGAAAQREGRQFVYYTATDGEVVATEVTRRADHRPADSDAVCVGPVVGYRATVVVTKAASAPAVPAASASAVHAAVPVPASTVAVTKEAAPAVSAVPVPAVPVPAAPAPAVPAAASVSASAPVAVITDDFDSDDDGGASLPPSPAKTIHESSLMTCDDLSMLFDEIDEEAVGGNSTTPQNDSVDPMPTEYVAETASAYDDDDEQAPFEDVADPMTDTNATAESDIDALLGLIDPENDAEPDPALTADDFTLVGGDDEVESLLATLGVGYDD